MATRRAMRGMAVISKALLLRRRLYRSRRCSLLLPRALSSFVVDDRTEVHRDDATVARHPTKRAPCARLEESRYGPCTAAHQAMVCRCARDRVPVPATDFARWCCCNAFRVIASTQTGAGGWASREFAEGSGRRCSQNVEHISSRQLSSASGGGSQSCRCALGSCQSTMTFYFVVSSFRRKWPLPPSRKRLRGKKSHGKGRKP